MQTPYRNIDRLKTISTGLFLCISSVSFLVDFFFFFVNSSALVLKTIYVNLQPHSPRQVDWLDVALPWLSAKHRTLLDDTEREVSFCCKDQRNQHTLSIGKERSPFLHVRGPCLCSMYSPCPKGFGSRLSPRLRGIRSYISYRHTVINEHYKQSGWDR